MTRPVLPAISSTPKQQKYSCNCPETYASGARPQLVPHYRGQWYLLQQKPQQQLDRPAGCANNNTTLPQENPQRPAHEKLKMGTQCSAAHNTVKCRRSAPQAKYTRTTTAFRQIHTHDGTHGEHQTNNRPSLDRPNSVVDLVAVPYLPRPDPASAHGFPGPPPSAPTKPACQS